ncbi:MAG: hypothetical protein SGJ00_02870 [bacterium]|nr:hypothetical protein [bacterium]
MMITRENYELFLIDYLDGNLDEEASLELMVFLGKHVDLNQEFKLLKGSMNLVLSPMDNLAKQDFSFLKKEEGMVITDEEMIAALEGDLGENEALEFNRKLLLYPQNQPAFDLFKKTKLQPENVVFNNKQLLKKKAGFLPLQPENVVLGNKQSFNRKAGILLYLNPRVLSIAAILLALFFIAVIYNSDSQKSKEVLASNENQVKQTPNNKDKEKQSNEVNKVELPKGKNEGLVNLGLEDKHESENAFSNKQVGKRLYDKGTLEHARLRKEDEAIKSILPMPNELENKQATLQLPAKIRELGTMEKIENLMASNGVGSDQEKENGIIENAGAHFLTPVDWLKIKMKQRLPETMNSLDSLNKGGAKLAGNMALQLVEKTTGITYHNRKDSLNGHTGFAIVSRYFAYERITK